MSAFAATRLIPERKTVNWQPPEPLVELIETPLTKKLFQPNLRNSIFLENKAIFGLSLDAHIVLEGCFKLSVLKGKVIINNVHVVDGEHEIVAPPSSAVPIISAFSKGDSPSPLSTFPVVVSISNLWTGLLGLSCYSVHLMPIYPTPISEYTFKLSEAETVHFTKEYIDCINKCTLASCEKRSSITVIAGSKSTGKTTLVKGIVNNINLAKQKVALLALDTDNSEFASPGTMSLSLKGSEFGKSFPNKVDEVYYGYSNVASNPDHYTNCCKRLIDVYERKYSSNGIHLVVDTAGPVKGIYGDVLSNICQRLEPNHFILLKVDEEESSDSIKCKQLSVLSASKRLTTSGYLMKQHNILTYFHNRGRLKFDFTRHILETPPSQIPLDRIKGVCVINFDLGMDNDISTVPLVEAMVMAVCTIKDVSFTQLKPLPYLDGSSFVSSEPEFHGLCLVHSVAKDHINLYHTGINFENVVLVRGEGEVPAPILMHSTFEEMPFVSFEAKTVGSVWRANRNVARKNQRK